MIGLSCCLVTHHASVYDAGVCRTQKTGTLTELHLNLLLPAAGGAVTVWTGSQWFQFLLLVLLSGATVDSGLHGDVKVELCSGFM